MKERFKALGYEAGCENNEYYIIAIDDEGWSIKDTLITFKDRTDMLDYMYKLENIRKLQMGL